MNTPTITFTPSAEDTQAGKLSIPGTCSLEQLYTHPNCPAAVKATLDKHVHWQSRCETPLYLGLKLKNEFMLFRAAMSVFGVSHISEEEAVNLEIGSGRVGYSLVRPTPAHTPIVGAFVRINLEEETVQDCIVALIGIEKRRLTLPDTQSMVGKMLTDELLDDYAKLVSDHYAGFDDFNGTAEYRKAMVKVTLQRALQEVKHG